MYIPVGVSRFGFGHIPGTGPGSTEQNLSVTDIISEGPIGGLVLGGKSIFLNDDPIFDDQEVGFSSTSGMTISGVSTSSNELTINNYDEDEFDYSPTNENEAGKRFILVHNLFEFVDSPSNSYTFNTTSSGTGPDSGIGFLLKISGDFQTLPSTIVAGTNGNSYTTISAGNFVSGDGIATIWNKTRDRFVEGMILECTDTLLSVVLNVKTIEESPWLTTSSLRINISQLLLVTSIEGNTIKLSENLSTNFDKKFFSISKPVYTSSTGVASASNKKYRSSGYQFRPGTLDQQPLSSLSGGVGNTTCLLYTSPSPRD